MPKDREKINWEHARASIAKSIVPHNIMHDICTFQQYIDDLIFKKKNSNKQYRGNVHASTRACRYGYYNVI